MHLVHINKMPHYLTKIIASVALSSTQLGLQSANTTAYANRELEQNLVSAASVLLVLMFRTACRHIVIL